MRRILFAVLILLAGQIYSPQLLLSEPVITFESEMYNDEWNRTGVTLAGVTLHNDSNPTIDRPSIIWSTTTANGLIEMRTGACMVDVPQNDSIMLMGGRMDPNPAGNQDESHSAMVEIFNIDNGSWEPSPAPMKSAQQYAGCTRVGDIVAMVGDWYPAQSNSYPTGIIQMYNISNGTWYNGTSMPNPHEIGHAGVESYGGYIYVAGGLRNPTGNNPTDRTYRYDLTNDTWTRMADMHHARYAFAFIEFHGLLYAIGGAQKTSSSAWVQPTALNYVEAYDPVNNVWLNQSAIPVNSFAWDAAILHDEIILAGGYSSGSMSNKVYGFNPIEDTWRTHGTMAVAAYDVAIGSLDGVITYATGDMSQYLYNTWSRMYSADTEWQDDIDYHTGYITSEVIDLRPSSESAATPISMTVNGQTNALSDVAWQWRGANNPATINQLDWQGRYGVDSWFGLGTWDLNSQVQANHMQYRLELNATTPAEWTSPRVDNVSIAAEHAGFLSSIPSTMNPNGGELVIQTTHQAFSPSEVLRLNITASTSTGSLNTEHASIVLDDGVFSFSDPNSILRTTPTFTSTTTNGVIIVNWSIDIASHSSIDYIRLSTTTEGETSTTHFHSNIIEIDDELLVKLESVESSWSSMGNDEVEEGEVIPGGYDLELTISSTFPSTGTKLASGKVEARAVFSLQRSDETWNNWTSEWSDLAHSSNTLSILTMPMDSGVISLHVEARSALDLDVSTSQDVLQFLLDSDNPQIINSIPQQNSYVNSEEKRSISIIISDVGGFSSDELEMWAWVQGDNDTNQDGKSQMNEYQQLNLTLEKYLGFWYVNSTLNDSANKDHDAVRLLLFGDDFAGHSIPTQDAEIGMVQWTTRDAQTSVLEDIEPLTQKNSRGQLMEIGERIGWRFTMSDANQISDLYEVNIFLGGDDDLGVKFTVSDERCIALDDRIQTDSLLCTTNVESNTRTLEVWLAADWYMDLNGLDQGRLTIELIDIDGVTLEVYNNQWYLQTSVDLEHGNFSDISGEVSGELYEGRVVAAGDTIRMGIDIIHSESRKPFSGSLTLRWQGTHNGLAWQGGEGVDIEAGWIDVEIALPNTGGSLDANLILLDPLERIELSVISIPEIIIDSEAPILLDSSVNWDLSRFHLDDIEIGINIDEDISWSGELNLTCKISSTLVEWPELSISSIPMRVTGGLTQFTFYLDMTTLGNPSTLSSQAALDCWALGRDDAGHLLTSSKENNQLDPWVRIPLTSEGPNLKLSEVEADEKDSEIKLKVVVSNNGEALSTPVNLSVWINKSGVREIVASQVIKSIGSSEQVMRASIAKPSGEFVLEVSIDEDNVVWELNESDNTWTRSYGVDQSQGVGTIVMAGGGLALIIIAALIIIRLRRVSEEDLDDLEEPEESTDRVVKGPPPASMSRRPPPSLPGKELVDLDINAAEAALASLTPTVESVADWSGLPAGGEYIYSADGTYYQGEACGRWKRNEDGSFVKQN